MEEIDIKQLATAFWEKKLHVMLIIVIFAIVGLVYTTFMVTPKYKSATTLVLATSESNEGNMTNSITQADVTLNQKLVSTYSEIIKSNSVLSKVLTNLNISSIKENELKKDISVKAVNNTELIEITVMDENNDRAALIANEIAKVFTERVEEIYVINNVHIIDPAQASNTPYNISHIRDLGIFIAIGFIIAAAYVVLMNIFDTSIRTTDDLEKLTGLFVLAEIPAYNFEGKMGGRI